MYFFFFFGHDFSLVFGQRPISMWLLGGHHLRVFLFHRPRILKFFFFFSFSFWVWWWSAARVRPFCTRVRHACEQCGLYLFGIRFFWALTPWIFLFANSSGRARLYIFFLSPSSFLKPHVQYIGY